MNRPELEERRKKLRNQSTTAEATLWKLLKGRQAFGLKFRRQHSVGSYILDFYCPEVRLAIELDGEVHKSQEVYDDARTLFLKQEKGITVLRYENRIVFEFPQQILGEIEEYLGEIEK